MIVNKLFPSKNLDLRHWPPTPPHPATLSPLQYFFPFVTGINKTLTFSAVFTLCLEWKKKKHLWFLCLTRRMKFKIQSIWNSSLGLLSVGVYQKGHESGGRSSAQLNMPGMERYKPVHPTVPDKKTKLQNTRPTDANTTVSPQVLLPFSSLRKQGFLNTHFHSSLQPRRARSSFFPRPATTLTTRLTKHLIAFPH